MDEIMDREADRQAAADQKRRDRSEEGPKEAGSAVAERMIRIRWPLRSPEGETEQQLAVGIRERMRGLGEKRRGARDQSSAELRRGNDQVRCKRDDQAETVPGPPARPHAGERM